MDLETRQSRAIIDHRRVASHMGAGLLGIALALFFGHRVVTPTSTDPDLDLVMITSTALDRGFDYWGSVIGDKWRTPRLVLINHDHGEQTPCGHADISTGPFYCPKNERIYLDIDFLRGIHGDLARAYVVAHELGHHVQKLNGELSGHPPIAIELQADCLAGAWIAKEQAEGRVSVEDIDAALEEAAAAGDDRLCPTCTMEQWRHGSSEQRKGALAQGMTGSGCDIHD